MELFLERIGLIGYPILIATFMYASFIHMTGQNTLCTYLFVGTRRRTVLFNFYMASGFFGLMASRVANIHSMHDAGDSMLVVARVAFLLASLVMLWVPVYKLLTRTR